MRKLVLGNLVCLIVGVSVSSCDPCTDCQPVSIEPNIEATFYNIDSLVAVQDSLVIIDTLRVVTDSLLFLVDSASRGGEYETEIASIEGFIDGLTDWRSDITDSVFADTLVYLRSELNVQVTRINTGSNPVNYFELVNTGLSTDYDSAVIHQFPLFMREEASSLYFEIGEEAFTLDINYDLYDELTADKIVKRRAYILSMTQTGFDSLFCLCNQIDTVECSSVECEAAETSISCYF